MRHETSANSRIFVCHPEQFDLSSRPREDTLVPDTIHCDVHGDTEKTYVCVHLSGDSSGLGFNRQEPSDENPYPDAWCDDCEIIRAAHGGWDSASEELCQIVLLCSECYVRARIRNTRLAFTLNDLSSWRWKCSDCDEWHTGPCLDLGYSKPYYWGSDTDKANRWRNSESGDIKSLSPTFLDSDFCSIDNKDFFIRGLIHLPIIGSAETFRWGIWGSLSRENFERLIEKDSDPARIELPPMFSWLSSQIPEYPDTLNLKMYTHIQEPGSRPHFKLERGDHPLAIEYHHGITPERVREIMFRHLPASEQ